MGWQLELDEDHWMGRGSWEWRERMSSAETVAAMISLYDRLPVNIPAWIFIAFNLFLAIESI